MSIREIQDKILKLKKQKDVCILAHAYQSEDIWEVADYIGDSFKLSQLASETKAKNVIMCGVKFMAETVKILSPNKNVFLANSNATCPMADQADIEIISQMKEKYPDYTVVAYINTTSKLKTICDVCVTSSSAVKIIKNIENDKILFIPDCNLGDWVAKQIPKKKFQFMRGGCPTHLRITPNDVINMKKLHKDALLLVHPECHPKIVQEADYVGSTTGIMNFAQNSDKKEFIIGTENSIVQHLQFKCLDKKFYPLSKECVCHNMKATTLMDVYNCLVNNSGEKIILSDDELEKSRKCIDEMLRLGNK